MTSHTRRTMMIHTSVEKNVETSRRNAARPRSLVALVFRGDFHRSSCWQKKSCLQNQSLFYFPTDVSDIAIDLIWNNPGYPERQRPTAEDMMSTFDKIYSVLKNHHSIVKGFLIMDLLFYTQRK